MASLRAGPFSPSFLLSGSATWSAVVAQLYPRVHQHEVVDNVLGESVLDGQVAQFGNVGVFLVYFPGRAFGQLEVVGQLGK